MPPTTHPPHDLEAERQRIAALLETEVINQLALLLSQASLYEQTMQANPQAYMAVSVLGSLIRQSLQKARDLQANLHPTVLEALGLEPALEALASQQTRTTGLRVTLDTGRLRQRLPVPVELVLFRTAQDLMDHAIQTAYATQARIQLYRHDHLVSFVYSDDGMWTPDLMRTLLDLLYSLQAAGARTEAERLSGETQEGLRVTVVFVVEGAVQLTGREQDIVGLLAQGLSNKEIAARLNVSARTVNFHLDNLYSKLGVNSRTEAVVYALRHGLAAPPD